MAKKNNLRTKVESIRHKDKRKNIPTEELRDFVVDEELAPKTRKGLSGIPSPSRKTGSS